MKLFLISTLIALAIGLNIVNASLYSPGEKFTYPECKSYDDPHMTTFDKLNYEFQYRGDHFILYDDFKDTRVTASYMTCRLYSPRATCNCAMYLKKGRSVVFIDFCNVPGTEKTLPVNTLYFSKTELNKNGTDQIEQFEKYCTFLNPKYENDESQWAKLPVLKGSYKCAKLVGGNTYQTYILRTYDSNCNDPVQVKIMIGDKNVPQLIVKPSKESFNKTGGLCGLWDNSRTKELYVMERDGSDKYLKQWNTGSADIQTARDFWRLGSRFNKDKNVQKRCPECYLMAERSFYCPCDEFDLFQDSNYHLNRSRDTYCKVPMPDCIRYKYFGQKPVITPVTPVPVTNTTVTPIIPPPDITLDEAFKLCKEGILNNSAIAIMIEKLILDQAVINETIEACALDLESTGDKDFVNLHKDVLIDNGLLIILGDYYNSTNLTAIESLLSILCPNNCNGKAVCKVDLGCFNLGNTQCTTPVSCQCPAPWGGKDCSQDLTNIEFDLDRQCCDIRSGKCDSVTVFAYPISPKNEIFLTMTIFEEYDDGSAKRFGPEKVKGTVENINSVSAQFNLMNQTTLYKVVNNIKVDKNLETTMTDVRITVSYNDNSNQFKNFKLYDSKCRTCNDRSLSLKPGKCEIEGQCWNENEKNTLDNDLTCDPSVSAITWTDAVCNLKTHYWTNWTNTDSPDGDGDLELFTLLKLTECQNPKKVQVQTVGKLPLEAAKQQGQVFHLNDSCFGFMCLNKQQPNNSTCLDYHFRHCCPQK